VHNRNKDTVVGHHKRVTSLVIINLDTCRTTDSTTHHWWWTIRHCSGKNMEQSVTGSDVINNIVNHSHLNWKLICSRYQILASDTLLLTDCKLTAVLMHYALMYVGM